jgi:hypothetical protein
MSIKKILSALMQVVADEVERNPEFRSRIEVALNIDPAVAQQKLATGEKKRKGGRRTPAVIDPVELARHGESALRAQLAGLDLEQLRDIVAEYGMDPGKLVMKWKDSNRIIDRIVELSLGRATKGDAFRKD